MRRVTTRVRRPYLVFATIIRRLHHERRRHGDYHGERHIGRAEGLAPDEADANTEDEDGPRRRRYRMDGRRISDVLYF